MSKRKEPAVGDVLGQWTLTRRIDDGRGGNSQVWHAQCGSEQAAVKILRRRDRLVRFLDEIRFLQGFEGAGVLRLIDTHLEGDSVYWYSMPLAEPLHEALERDRSPQRVVEIFAIYADTLAQLAEQDVSHRDLKPDNLFILDGTPVLGDFGLVVYPDKQSITEASERIGPMHFHAPQMISDTDEADPKAADVWSFAKSLWAVLTGNQYPLPGEYRLGRPYDLGEWISHPRIAELNNLVAHCTRYEPQERPTMREVADELRLIARQPAELRADAAAPELRERLIALTQPMMDAELDGQMQRQRIDATRIEISTRYGEVANNIQAMLGGRFKFREGQANDASSLLQAKFSPGATATWVATLGGMYYSPDRVGRIRIQFSVAALLVDATGRLEICAHLRVSEYFSHLENTLVDWHEFYPATMGSARFDQAFSAIRAKVDGSEQEMLRKITEVLARPEDHVPTWFVQQQRQ